MAARGPRPEGTDGTDYEFREVVEDRYKRMARYLRIACITVPVLVVATLIKTCWHAIPYIVAEELPKYYAFTQPGIVALAVGLFYLARPKKRVRLAVMKVASCFFILAALSHVMTSWKYHHLDPPQRNYATRLTAHLRATGVTAADVLEPVLRVLDGGLDLALMAAIAAVAGPVHFWIGDAMDADKESRQRVAAAKADRKGR